jgi:hypothetical protein
MLTVAPGLVKVPSPLNWINSTMAFGCATPATILNPGSVEDIQTLQRRIAASLSLIFIIICPHNTGNGKRNRRG